MQGSLDQPPIVVRADRKSVAAGLAGALFVFAACWYFGREHTNVLFLAGLAAFVCGGVLLTSPQMQISPDGLSRGIRLGKNSWPWNDFDQFEVRQVPVFGITCVGCTFSATHAGGPAGVIGLFWEVPTPDLVMLLNQARERWTRMPLAGPVPIE